MNNNDNCDNIDNCDNKRSKRTRKADGDGGRKANWKEYTATVEEIKSFLTDRIYLRHNVITGRVEYRIPAPDLFSASDEHGWARNMDFREDPCFPDAINMWQPINDRIVNSLWVAQSREKTLRVQDVYRVIESDFVPEYHPFRFYLEHLPPWNGEDHILAMSVSVSVKGDVEEQMRFYEYLKKWLVGMVAGWIDETVVNNVILVLIGPQGSYKTTWFNHILPPVLRPYFYTKTNANRMGRDDLLTLAQYGLVCCEELDTMRPSELNQLKAAVTMPSIDERAAYAHFHEHRKHIASFCGTGNNAQFLSDPTGNRRWLPFEIDSIESPREKPFDYEGIYAQAYALYRDGFQYWFSQQEIVQLAVHNQTFETPQIEQELVDVFFRQPNEHESGEFMPVSRALQIVGGSLTQHVSASRLGQAFKSQGYEYKRTAHSRGYIVVQRDAGEIKERLKMLAKEDEPI